MPTVITLSGWKEFEAKLKNMPKMLEREIDGEVRYTAEHWAGLAKNAAPVDQGFLAGGIDPKHLGNMTSEVTSNALYSAYMEWGTKGKVRVPADLSSYASQFKGKGVGDYYDFLNAILDWVIRKGIAARWSVKSQKPIAINVNKPSKGKQGKDDYERLHDTAYAIALSIIRHGVKPQPFLFPHRPAVQAFLNKSVQAVLNRPH